jgi:hypothetical protein
MEEENRHVSLNVSRVLVCNSGRPADAQIDCKIQNDPERLFVSSLDYR